MGVKASSSSQAARITSLLDEVLPLHILSFELECYRGQLSWIEVVSGKSDLMSGVNYELSSVGIVFLRACDFFICSGSCHPNSGPTLTGSGKVRTQFWMLCLRQRGLSGRQSRRQAFHTTLLISVDLQVPCWPLYHGWILS